MALGITEACTWLFQCTPFLSNFQYYINATSCINIDYPRYRKYNPMFQAWRTFVLMVTSMDGFKHPHRYCNPRCPLPGCKTNGSSEPWEESSKICICRQLAGNHCLVRYSFSQYMKFPELSWYLLAALGSMERGRTDRKSKSTYITRKLLSLWSMTLRFSAML